MGGRNYLLYEAFKKAYDDSEHYILNKLQIFNDFKNINFFTSHVYANCFPPDYKSMAKVGFFPVNEAGLELEYSLFLAKGGMYKTAFMCLRNFLELSLICFYFLLQNDHKKPGVWSKGDEDTPFKKEYLEALFKNKDFQFFDKSFLLKDKIDEQCDFLSDFCHTKGQPCSHVKLTFSNFPRFIENSLLGFLTRVKEIINIVITCFTCVNPLILFPLPVTEKMGLNGPMTGFLEEGEVEILHKLLKPETLNQLIEYYKSDDRVVSVRRWFNSFPDITEEEFENQAKEFNKLIGGKEILD
jgi:hypothetical protein